MAYALNELGIVIFNAETHEANTRSRRMLGNLGFKEISRIGMEQYMGEESRLIQYRFCVSQKV
ncbi:hypothetical protein C1N55_03500 [Lysinibacillus sp. SGAir0095]|nr:hypothetical protein C1N55_03500 [Lysinibacillus sp. SGAir0095]